jgi:hypothetical protein
MAQADSVHSTPPLSTSKNDNDLSKLPQREINLILDQWQRERVLGIPAQNRLRQLLGVLKGERLAKRKDSAEFESLADAEAFLTAQGFWLIPDSCNWTNSAGDDAGVYSIVGGRYGAVKGFRVEINRDGGAA